jgi:hypothetical protein
MKKLFVLIAAIVAVTAIAVTAASAGVHHHTVEIDSNVTFSSKAPPLPPGGHKLHGRVESKRHACEVDRKVKVFHVQRGPGRNGLHATERTNQRGQWVHGHGFGPGGGYYARVVRTVVHTKRAAGTIVCEGDRSPTRQFRPEH